ncbi:MAG TPA: Ni/Fe hydrogenase subunit alpha [Candidatus Bathyarchaeia archaeon]|nr:Ni/Fe hydrogenase subunit alpha [Candidatus Bathyarchaeia archaeon]
MKDSNVNIEVNHVTRVEGHGNIYVNVKKGIVEKCEWNVPEAPRFFEAMVVGRQWNELHHITSRICGICSIGHTLASLKATEAAMGISISEQDLKLRKLALHAENLQSHLLHLGFLVLPDLLGVGSVIPLASSNPQEVKTVFRLHRTANEMSNLICGRTTHPQRLIPGGFSKIPSLRELSALKKKLQDCIPDLQAVAKLIKSLAGKLPDFTRETEFIGLTSQNEYALYDGQLASTDTGKAPVNEYISYTNEYIVPTSTAKRAKHARESYMVGALARLNLNYDKLSASAKEVAEMFGLKPVCHNPFMNNIAQLVETVHSIDDSVRLINELESAGLQPQQDYFKPEIKVKAGNGVGAVEVPRGILFHDYTYNAKGVCTKANCVIPTNQNHGNIELDMKALVPKLLDKKEKEIELALEMLVRAYDPCISCSTHAVKVHFI